MTLAIFIDTESTGFNEPKATEIAWLDFYSDHKFYSRFNPGKPIELGATAITHIFDEDVKDEPPAESFKLPEGVKYIIAHNVDYDWGVLGKPDVKRICTLAISRYLWPDLDAHNQTAMMYHYFGSEARPWVKDAHNALCDVVNLDRLYNKLVDTINDRGLVFSKEKMYSHEEVMEMMWQFSEEARIPVKMPFGKHKGELIKDVPLSWITWYMQQPDQDEYIVKAFRKAGKIK